MRGGFTRGGRRVRDRGAIDVERANDAKERRRRGEGRVLTNRDEFVRERPTSRRRSFHFPPYAARSRFSLLLRSIRPALRRSSHNSPTPHAPAAPLATPPHF